MAGHCSSSLATLLKTDAGKRAHPTPAPKGDAITTTSHLGSACDIVQLLRMTSAFCSRAGDSDGADGVGRDRLVATLRAMEEKSQAFVDAAAQIIPVLVLALLADPVNRRTRPGHSGLILSALLAGVLGEFVALLGVVLGTDAGANKFIGACMAVLAVAILYPHATQPTLGTSVDWSHRNCGSCSAASPTRFCH